jgi:DNA-directed RNA polymerase subunit M/transcription elongation factor TFIIS
MIDKKTRDKVFAQFNKLFDHEIATKIEKSIFDFSVDYAENNNTPFLLENIYTSKAEEIYCMVKDNNLRNAINAIKDKKLDPSKIAIIKPSEISMILSNKQYIDIIKKREVDMMLNEKKGTTAFECKKCKKRNATVFEKQVQRADEPATQFITCLECGHAFMI